MKVSQKQKPLLPEAKKTPRLFRLKVAALVVLILIAIVAIIDSIFFLYLSSHPEPTANLSFINNIITNTSILTSGATVEILLNNMLTHNPSAYFQESVVLAKGQGNEFTEAMLKSVFRQKNKNLLYIFDLKNGITPPHKFAVYAASSFPLPGEDNYNKDLDYYTFEQTDKRYSMIFSLQNQSYLIMNSTSQKIEYLQCKTYSLSEKNGIFNLFSILDKTINNSNPNLSLSEITNQYKCFYDVNNKDQLVQKINSVIGHDIMADNVRIESFEIYYLDNEQ